jgi:hypothetical protein
VSLTKRLPGFRSATSAHGRPRTGPSRINGQECSRRNICRTCLGGAAGWPDLSHSCPWRYRNVGRPACSYSCRLQHCSCRNTGGDKRSRFDEKESPPRPRKAEPRMFLQEHIAVVSRAHVGYSIYSIDVWMAILHKLQKCSCRNAVENAASCRFMGRLHFHRMLLTDHFRRCLWRIDALPRKNLGLKLVKRSTCYLSVSALNSSSDQAQVRPQEIYLFIEVGSH